MKVVIEYSRTIGRGKSEKEVGVVEKLNEKIFSFWKISFLETLLCDCYCYCYCYCIVI